MTNFGRIAPSEPVFGVCRPGHLGEHLDEWAETLASANVARVVCLLSESEARRYRLPERYADRFETAHAPIRDRHLPDADVLETALDSIRAAESDGTGCVLHCNAGLGRTGVVGAAWLTSARGYDPLAAIETVEDAGRSPREAVRCGNATLDELLALLDR
jgi:atypical dual specificity phosphatase